MDRTFVKNFDRTPVYQRGMEIWTEEIIRKGEVGHHLRRLFLEQARPCRARVPTLCHTCSHLCCLFLERAYSP